MPARESSTALQQLIEALSWGAADRKGSRPPSSQAPGESAPGHREVDLRHDLEACSRAALSIGSSLDLNVVLQAIVDEARAVARAKYAALGILSDSTETFALCAFSGVDEETVRRIGRLPRPAGLWGKVAREGRVLREADLRESPRSRGFPEGHPPMKSFLGVPITYGGRALGNLYLAEKEGASDFSDDDARAIELLARHAGLAVEHARIHGALVAEVEKRRQSEENLEVTLNSIGDAVLVTDAEGRVARMNPVAQRLTGWALEEAKGQPVAKVLRLTDEVDGRPVEDPVRRALDGWGTHGLPPHTALVARDGRRWSVADSCAPILSGEAKVTGAVLVLRDVTAERQAEEELRQSEERFRLLVQGVTDYAIFMLDPGGNVTTWNAGAERILGYRAEEIIGRHFSDFHPDPLRRANEPWRQLEIAADRGSHEEEGLRRRQDGSTFFAQVLLTALAQSDGRPRGFAMLIRDVTERRRLAREREELFEQLQAERQWLRAVLHHSPIGLILVEGQDGERIEPNLRAEAMLGRRLDPEGGIRQYLSQIRGVRGEALPPDEVPGWRALHGAPVDAVERLVVQPGGGRVPVMVSAVPMFGPDKTIAGAVVAFMDVTPLKELDRLREEWTSLIAHDLRQPINTLSLYLGLFGRRSLSDLDQKNLEFMRQSLAQLSRMIDDLRDFACIEAKRLEVRPTRIDLAAWLQDFAERHGPELAQNPLRCELGSELPEVEVDTERLEQVLSNLVSNGVKYGLAGAELVLGARGGGGEVVISVTNRGEGLSSEEITNLFGRFARTERAKNSTQEGLGLGLYIAKGLVEAHRGRLWAESERGKRTTFFVALPADA